MVAPEGSESEPAETQRHAGLCDFALEMPSSAAFLALIIFLNN